MSENENFDEQAGDGGPAGGDGSGEQSGPDDRQTFEDIVEGVELETPEESGAGDAPSEEARLENLLAERTEDLQRLQAEYVNFKKRSDRERNAAKQGGVEKVVASLVPVLDAIHMAREHGEVTEGSGFKAVTDALEKVAADHELTSFGEVGDAFDPYLHNALMQIPLPGATVVSVSQVMGRGYKVGDRVVRPAQVAVSDPDPEALAGGDEGDDAGVAEAGGSADDTEK
ncbi:nucleotide exchange factor GrpE [Acidipropionibacterium virtanenii]|uniref:Protein GrpE n=1 Tax=Acidipropionibacterium virtanenii TaxID=2057246 RepID=A0A344UWU3_9ACTN|nr:nucleotide exchange factor GrpE [Acidipropionibacterium virtanenii]AXE39741.1 Protein GrpE [Acidipropionibacterium virtanenii]